MGGRLILPVGYPAPAREARRALWLAQLRHRGWQTTVYTPDVPAVDAPLKQAGIDLRHLPFRGLTDYSTIRHLSKHLEREAQGAAIITQSYRSAFIALCARKLASRPDMHVALLDRTLKQPATTWLARRVYRNLSAIIFTSLSGLEIFHSAERVYGKALTPPERLHVVMEGVGTAPEPLEEPKGPIMALYNGELRAGSGLERLIDALESLRGKRLRLMIAGQGRPDYMDALRRRAISRGVMDMISWRRERPLLSEVAAQCHFGIFPYEGERFSDGNIELMAAGRPQIVTDNGIAREYLGNDGGAIYASGIDAMCEAMLNLAADAAKRRESGEEARRRYQATLNPEQSLEAIEKILSQ